MQKIKWTLFNCFILRSLGENDAKQISGIGQQHLNSKDWFVTQYIPYFCYKLILII